MIYQIIEKYEREPTAEELAEVEALKAEIAEENAEQLQELKETGKTTLNRGGELVALRFNIAEHILQEAIEKYIEEEQATAESIYAEIVHTITLITLQDFEDNKGVTLSPNMFVQVQDIITGKWHTIADYKDEREALYDFIFSTARKIIRALYYYLDKQNKPDDKRIYTEKISNLLVRHTQNIISGIEPKQNSFALVRRGSIFSLNGNISKGYKVISQTKEKMILESKSEVLEIENYLPLINDTQVQTLLDYIKCAIFEAYATGRINKEAIKTNDDTEILPVPIDIEDLISTVYAGTPTKQNKYSHKKTIINKFKLARQLTFTRTNKDTGKNEVLSYIYRLNESKGIMQIEKGFIQSVIAGKGLRSTITNKKLFYIPDTRQRAVLCYFTDQYDLFTRAYTSDFKNELRTIKSIIENCQLQFNESTQKKKEKIKTPIINAFRYAEEQGIAVFNLYYPLQDGKGKPITAGGNPVYRLLSFRTAEELPYKVFTEIKVSCDFLDIDEYKQEQDEIKKARKLEQAKKARTQRQRIIYTERTPEQPQEEPTTAEEATASEVITHEADLPQGYYYDNTIYKKTKTKGKQQPFAERQDDLNEIVNAEYRDYFNQIHDKEKQD